MAHVRKQVREAAVGALKGATAAGLTVYENRRSPVPEKKVPAWLVYTTDERSELLSDDECGKRYARTVSLELVAVAAGEDAEDALDQLAAEGEVAIEADPTLGGIVRDLVLTGTRDVFSAEGERVAGAKRLTYEATYQTRSGAPETAL